MNLRRSLAALVLASVLVPTAAYAEISDADKGTARELTIQGGDALKARDYTTAADRFSRAERLFEAGNSPVPPTIRVGLARASAALGKLVTAQELYSKVTHETIPPNASAALIAAVEEAQRELAALTPRVPGVVINVKGTDAVRVTLDGNEVPSAAFGVKRLADPGKHVVRALAVGFSPAEAAVTLTEGKVEAVTLELKPGPGGPTELPGQGPAGGPAGPVAGPGGGAVVVAPVDTSAPTRRKVGFVGIGVGAAGLIVGAITGGMALSKHSSIAGHCPNGVCPSSSQYTQAQFNSDLSSYNTLGGVSTAGFIAGGVLAATGIILVATAPRSVQTGSISPVIGAGYLGAQGRF
jgi:hypothetical protein